MQFRVRPMNGIVLVWSVALMVALLAAMKAHARKPRRTISLIVAEFAGLVLVLAMMACSGSRGGSNVADPVAGTPPGTFTVMVTASVTIGQANVQRTLPISIVIQ